MLSPIVELVGSTRAAEALALGETVNADIYLDSFVSDPKSGKVWLKFDISKILNLFVRTWILQKSPRATPEDRSGCVTRNAGKVRSNLFYVCSDRTTAGGCTDEAWKSVLQPHKITRERAIERRKFIKFNERRKCTDGDVRQTIHALRVVFHYRPEKSRESRKILKAMIFISIIPIVLVVLRKRRKPLCKCICVFRM